MDRHHHFVNKVSRFFPSSLASCKSRSLPDVMESSIPIAKAAKNHNPRIQSPKPFSNIHNKPSMIKSRDPKTLLKNDLKLSGSYRKSKSRLLCSDAEGRKCPPVTPISVMALQKKGKVKETKKNRSCSSNSGRWFSNTDDGEGADTFFSLSSCSSEPFRRRKAEGSSWRRYDNKVFSDLGRCSSALSAYSVNTALSRRSGGENHEKISTRNYDSKTCEKWQIRERCKDKFGILEDKILKGCEIAVDLTEVYYGSFRGPRCRKTGTSHRKNVRNGKRRKSKTRAKDDRHHEFVVVDDDDSRVEDSYAVEKSSSDPYGDFRTSMVEMIIEKQIFGAKDLEKLLDCFLYLNSSYYHRVIVEVFMEICDTLLGI